MNYTIILKGSFFTTKIKNCKAHYFSTDITTQTESEKTLVTKHRKDLPSDVMVIVKEDESRIFLPLRNYKQIIFPPSVFFEKQKVVKEEINK